MAVIGPLKPQYPKELLMVMKPMHVTSTTGRDLTLDPVTREEAHYGAWLMYQYFLRHPSTDITKEATYTIKQHENGVLLYICTLTALEDFRP